MSFDHSSTPQHTHLALGRVTLQISLSLINSEPEPIYDRFTKIASEILEAPVSLMSMVSFDFQFFKSMIGLPEPWASRRQTPLSHSFCQHVVNPNRPLIVHDAREIDFLIKNQAIPDLNVIAYLGMPVGLTDGQTLGSFCLIDHKPRTWTETEIKIMSELAAIIGMEFDTRALARAHSQYQADLRHLHQQIQSFFDAFDAIPDKNRETFLQSIYTWRKQHDI